MEEGEMMNQIDEIRKAIKKAETDEIVKALDHSNFKLKSEFISRFSSLKIKNREGILTSDEVDAKQNKIIRDLLSSLDEIQNSRVHQKPIRIRWILAGVSLIGIAIISYFLLSIFKSTPQKGNISLEGRDYKTLAINETIWLAEPLHYEAVNSNCDPKNCEEFGRLYSFDTAEQTCRHLGQGWSIPSDIDWLHLFDYVNGGYIDVTSRGKVEVGDAEHTLSHLQKLGFRIQRGGSYRDPNNNYIFNHSIYWGQKSGYRSGEKIVYHLPNGNSQFERVSFPQELGMYCLCVKKMSAE